MSEIRSQRDGVKNSRLQLIAVRYFGGSFTRVPATPILVAWETYETSFQPFQASPCRGTGIDSD